MSLTTAITDLLPLFYELFASIFGTIYHVVSSFFIAILNFFLRRLLFNSLRTSSVVLSMWLVE